MWCLSVGAISQAEALAAPQRKLGAKKPPPKSVGTTSGAPACASPKPKYQVSGWTGDDFTIGHEFRDGQLPKGIPPQVEKEYEFIIVGAGIGGLSAAHYLRDHDILLLDQYEQLGGQSRGGSYRGMHYTYGPSSVDSIDDIYGELYAKLGIHPEKLPLSDNSFYFETKWASGSSKDSNSLYRSFKELSSALLPTFKMLPPQITPDLAQQPDLAKLDAIPFSSILKTSSPELTGLINNITKANACGTIDQVSALAGNYLLADLTKQSYAFKGGNTAITRGLLKNISEAGPERVVGGTFVWQVELKESGAEVIYSDKLGTMHRVSCRHVIVATPPMVAWRQFVNLPDKMRASLMPFKYGSYLVANFLLKKKLFTGPYDNWVSNPFTFADIVIGETPYTLAGDYKADMGSILTVYNPWEPGSQGRTILFVGDREQLSSNLYKQVATLVEHLDQHLEEIVLTRWGHAMVVPGVNHFARLRKISENSAGPYSLAHSSTQGMPRAESAIRAGHYAAKRALATSAKTSLLFNP